MLKLMNHASKHAGIISSKVVGYPFPTLHPSKQELELMALLLTRRPFRLGPTSCEHCVWLIPLQLVLQARHVDLVSCSIMHAQHNMLSAWLHVSCKPLQFARPDISTAFRICPLLEHGCMVP